MALPSSGQITMQMIVNEFGGTAPYSLSQYYRGGGRVPDTSTNANVPTSGQISYSNFYGASATIPPSSLTLTGGRTDLGSAVLYGFSSTEFSIGSLSPSTHNGVSILRLAHFDPDDNTTPGNVTMIMAGSQSQSFFTKVEFTGPFFTDPTELFSSSASFSITGGNSYWQWSVPGTNWNIPDGWYFVNGGSHSVTIT